MNLTHFFLLFINVTTTRAFKLNRCGLYYVSTGQNVIYIYIYVWRRLHGLLTNGLLQASVNGWEDQLRGSYRSPFSAW